MNHASISSSFTRLGLIALCFGPLALSSHADSRADLNGDQIVDAADLTIFFDRWGPAVGHFGDLNLDGMVDSVDLARLLNVWNYTYATAVYTPTFELDYAGCGPTTAPTVSTGGAGFGSASSPYHAGRVVSTAGYKNITRIEADINIAGMTGNFINASFYMVESASSIQQTYCDSGNAGSPWCNEIDFLETNANALTQTTVHLNSSSANTQQRYEYSFGTHANTSCYAYSTLVSDATMPKSGTHNLVNIIDFSSAFHMVAEYNLVSPSMKVTYSQTRGKQTYSAVVYDSTMVIACTNQGSGQTWCQNNAGGAGLDMSLLPASMQTGWWLVGSMWQGYAPGQYNQYWTGSCSWASLCQGPSYWSLSNVRVTAESQFN